jgi:hypothetical protein
VTATPPRPDRWVLTVAAASCWAGAAVAQSAEPFASTARLTGAAAWQTLVGNTVVADTRAGSYTEFFKPDGSVLHLDQDGRSSGKWTLKDPKVCFDFPEDDEQICTDVEVSGQKGAFIDQDGGRDNFSILPGNAKGL